MNSLANMVREGPEDPNAPYQKNRSQEVDLVPPRQTKDIMIDVPSH